MGKYRLICILLFALLIGAGGAWAQISSPAFDPNCYFPRIGVPGEIDTIYGARPGSYLGFGMLNLGPAPDGSFGRLTWEDSDVYDPMIYKSWPSFNIHKLNKLGNFNLPALYSIVRFGHFHSPKYRDILASGNGSAPARIYWEDDQGNFDTSRYTELGSKLSVTSDTENNIIQPYSAHISSDTVEDIICSIEKYNRQSSFDSVYLFYFTGANLRKQAKIVYADSTILFDTLSHGLFSPWAITAEGDFRGTGREDLLMYNNRNILYYKNDSPFSMSSLVHSLKYDTVFAQWENPKNVNEFEALTMQALSKGVGDSSSDFVAAFRSNYGRSRTIDEFRIFRGGIDFGKNRWTADSAAFVIHEPYYYDLGYEGLGFGSGLHDCGHMTGTQNRVLYVEGHGSGYAYELFYLLGDAIDDKADMVILPNGTGGIGGGANYNVDTVVADNDNLQDIIMGEAGLGTDVIDDHGSIFVVHGSLKIPERTRSVSLQHEVDTTSSHIAVHPNPCLEHTVLTLENKRNEHIKVFISDILGKLLLSEETQAVDGLQNYSIDLSTYPAGEYIVALFSPSSLWRGSVHIIKTGPAVQPWSLDLKKMVGR